MKVQSTKPPGALQGAEIGPRTTSKSSETSKKPATRVSLSSDASFISSVQQEASELPLVREEVVDQTRAALADGSFEASVDLDAVADGLLAEL